MVCVNPRSRSAGAGLSRLDDMFATLLLPASNATGTCETTTSTLFTVGCECVKLLWHSQTLQADFSIFFHDLFARLRICQSTTAQHESVFAASSRLALACYIDPKGTVTFAERVEFEDVADDPGVHSEQHTSEAGLEEQGPNVSVARFCCAVVLGR